jgi:hypothetical protein
MLLLNRSLSSSERDAALQEVTAFVDETYNQNEKRAKEVE